MIVPHFNRSVGHEVDKKAIKKKIQHGIFGLVKITKEGKQYYVKEASKRGHDFDEREGLVVKDVDNALRDV